MESKITNEEAVIQHAAFMFAKTAETLLRCALRSKGYQNLTQLPDKERNMYTELFDATKRLHRTFEALNEEMTTRFFTYDKFKTEDALSAESMDYIRLYLHLRNLFSTRQEMLDFEQQLLNIEDERGADYLNREFIQTFKLYEAE